MAMDPTRHSKTLALLLGLWLAAAGCKKTPSEQGEPAMPPPMAETEAERGEQACQAYVERVCACAEAKPDSAELKEQCELAPAKVSSLNMVLEVHRAPKDTKERVRTERTARRIVASCIEAQSQLDSRGCP